MRSERLERALQDGVWTLPEGPIAVYRPRAGDDLSTLLKDRVVVLTGFRPDHDHFAAQGYATELAGSYAGALVCLPRARDHARAILAQASSEVVPGGLIAVDGQKTDGIETALKDLRARVLLGPALSKAHGKLAVFSSGADLSGWAAQDIQIADGFITRPGVFSADGPDRGSALLASLLPTKLGPKVVDLGAGWGYLSRAVLMRDGVKRLDVVEAEFDALTCARSNIDDPRARFHWADATRFRPENLAECVVMNPPFHVGRDADPALGVGFIAAARGMMAPDGVLWLVANRHLPYDAALAAAFLEVEQVGADSAFRVIRAARPRRRP